MEKQEFIDKHFRGCSPEYFDIVSSDLDAVIVNDVQVHHVSETIAKPIVSSPLPGSDEDLAAEIIARYRQNNGRHGRITKMLKEAFVDGAIWMKERLSGI